jgi:cobyrinic acid a,c-diamide synthase
VRLPPRLVIAAPQGRSGKTTVTISLAGLLRKRGIRVQAFKKGPDYIDPSWIAAASGRPCFNLDAFMMGDATVIRSFADGAQGADIALVEGAMGLFDGIGKNGEGTAAALSRLIGAPVILVVNASRMTRSVAAMVSGYQHFEPGTDIGGVILNRVSGNRHREKLTDAIERHCAIPVLGAVPKAAGSYINERHLGLVPACESDKSQAIIEEICRRMEPHLDLDGILRLAQNAPERTLPVRKKKRPSSPRCTIGVFRDRVFTFYYPENLEALGNSGARLVFLDSMNDRLPEDLDGLYIGGGFPELHCRELEANGRLRRDLASRIDSGLPVYAECGGLMYLCRAVIWKENRWEMTGVIPAEVELTERPAGHGYVEAEVVADTPFFAKGFTLRGHEFHHSRLILKEDLKLSLKLKRGYGIDGRSDGFAYKNVFAAYTHLHALGTPEWARNFIDVVMKEKQVKAEVKIDAGPKHKRMAGR